jgi:hypothetical protein
MKKFVAFVMILSLGLLTIGCTPAETPKKEEGKKPPVTTTATEKDKAPAYPAATDKTPEKTPPKAGK